MDLHPEHTSGQPGEILGGFKSQAEENTKNSGSQLADLKDEETSQAEQALEGHGCGGEPICRGVGEPLPLLRQGAVTEGQVMVQTLE